MVQVLSLTLFALLVARVVRAPRGTWRYILGAAAAVLLASQLLPVGNAFRVDVAESSRALAWLGVAAVPVAAYGMWVRRLRLRSGADRSRAAPEHPTGLVQIAEDMTLARDTAAALDAEAAATGRRPETVSLGWRAGDGALAGHLRLRLLGGTAEIEMLRVAPEVRRQGIASRLLAAAEGEARQRGIGSMIALVGDWQVRPFFEATGFREVARSGAVGLGRVWMEKVLA